MRWFGGHAQKGKVKNRTLYEPNAKDAAPTFCLVAKGAPPATHALPD